eukprot:gene3335-17126_t
MATSSILVQHSHKKGIDEVLRLADKAFSHLHRDPPPDPSSICQGHASRGLHFEYLFRSSMDDVLKVYRGVSEMGVDRIGIADTAYRVVSTVRRAIPAHVGIEFHAHNDTGDGAARLP